MSYKGRRRNKRTKTLSIVALVVLVGITIGIVCAIAFHLSTHDRKAAEHAASDVEVETPYCTLHYPKEWENEVHAVCEQQNDKYVVVFVGKIGNREVNLFSIIFGVSEEMPIGTLKMEDGDEVTVHLDLELLETDEGWSDAEIALADEMINASGYTTEILAQQDNFH